MIWEEEEKKKGVCFGKIKSSGTAEGGKIVIGSKEAR